MVFEFKMQHTKKDQGEAPAGPPPLSAPQTGLSKKARRKASMLRWRLEKQQEHQRQDQQSDNNITLEGEEEDFYRLKNAERSKYPWNRPDSSFPARMRWTTQEGKLNDRWEAAKVGNASNDRRRFILLDGPPYANGPIHLGHVLNKVLKDTICKYKRMSGFDVVYQLGWDCHGLPIEKLVSDDHGPGEELEALNFLRSCKAHASKWVENQRQSTSLFPNVLPANSSILGFRKLGILANWDSPYRTDDPKYQAAVVRAFAKFVDDGYVEHNLRPVPWCVSCQTVLAHAEISHNVIVDPSCFVFFPCTDREQLLAIFEDNPTSDLQADDEVGFLVWTTSPWSLPLNRGVALNPTLDYCLVDYTVNSIDGESATSKKTFFVVAKDCIDALRKSLNEVKPCRLNVVGRPVRASELASKIGTVGHPIMEGLEVKIVLHSKVSAKIGTAILHVAPGCCEEVSCCLLVSLSYNSTKFIGLPSWKRKWLGNRMSYG